MRSAERGAGAQPTLRAVLRRAVRRLKAARVSYGHGTTNAHDEAAWLALHALGLPLDELEPHLDRTLAGPEAGRIDALIDERIRSRKPAAYLTHEAWLGDHAFYVDERVIVPRSFIAELLREDLAPWLPQVSAVARALDLCTGSGCLAILLALTFAKASVDASDVSEEALEVARRNVAAYRLSKRVKLVRSDLYSRLGARKYDLIAANPPYVTAAAMRALPLEYRREPALALAGGRDGLDLVRRIVAKAPAHLEQDGVLVVEVGHNREGVERAFPHLQFAWPQTSGGDDCVFVITRQALLAPARPRAARVRARSLPASRGAASPRLRAARSPVRASTSAAVRRRRSARGSGGSP
jgi:ribosomal protein L3 glutamine methyltransferase